jgi:hypothetical protein
VEIYELINIALSIGNRIDLQWTLFITVHLALLGAIVYIDRPLRKFEKIAALMIYCGFAFINFQQMNNQVLMVGSVYSDVLRLSTEGPNKNLAIVQRMANEAKLDRSGIQRNVLISSHVFMFLLVVVSVIFDRKLIIPGKRLAQKEPDSNGGPDPG